MASVKVKTGGTAIKIKQQKVFKAHKPHRKAKPSRCGSQIKQNENKAKKKKKVK